MAYCALSWESATLGSQAQHAMIVIFLLAGLACTVVAFTDRAYSTSAAILAAGFFVACGHLGAAKR